MTWFLPFMLGTICGLLVGASIVLFFATKPAYGEFTGGELPEEFK